MAPGNIGRVKQRVRGLDLVAASRRARAIMDQLDAFGLAIHAARWLGAFQSPMFCY